MADEASGLHSDEATCHSCGATVGSGLRLCPECGAYLTVEAEAASTPYPVTLTVDYPERQSRWKALLRLPLIVPLLVFYYLLGNGIAVAIWAAILVRGRIPRWLFDFQVAFNRWGVRFSSYALLLTDQYPPFEGDYPIRYDVQYPERLSRWRLVIWKFITSVPHFIVVAVLTLTLVLVVPIGWFAVLFTGRFPSGLHGYVGGVLRWGARVHGYTISLTDEFPPFSLSAEAGPGGRDSCIISAVVGLLATAGVIAITTVVIVFFQPGEEVVEVSYQRLLAGEVSFAETRVSTDAVTVEITGAADPAGDLLPLLVPQQGHRFVLFGLFVENETSGDLRVREKDFRIKSSEGGSEGPLLVAVNGRVAPVSLEQRAYAFVDLLFELPQGVDPAELRYDLGRIEADTIVYEFR